MLVTRITRFWSWRLVIAASLFTLLAAPVPTYAHEARSIHGESLRIVSSVQVSREVVEKAVRAGREAYSSTLQPLAKIPPEAAKKAALGKIPNSVCTDIALQSLRKNLVYMALLQKEAAHYLVIVDAGNGTVLASRDLGARHHRAHWGI